MSFRAESHLGMVLQFRHVSFLPTNILESERGCQWAGYASHKKQTEDKNPANVSVYIYDFC